LFCLAAGCNEGPDNEVFLQGQVYDGATGMRLTSYKISVNYRNTTLTGKVGADGTFLIEHLPVFQDYTVAIDATGYRVFRSHNPPSTSPTPTRRHG
jgi:hypothetical protein